MVATTSDAIIFPIINKTTIKQNKKQQNENCCLLTATKNKVPK